MTERHDGIYRLPPVVPVVLYDGTQAWTAPRDVADLIPEVPELEHLRPRFRYVLLDEVRESLGSLPEQSLLRPVLLLERARSVDELKQAVHVAVERVEALRNDELKRDVAMWLRRSLVPTNFPWLEAEGFEELRMFESRLERTVQQWTQDWLAEGRAEGLTQGLSEGRRDGEASALLRLLERKFGSVPSGIRRRIEAADVETLGLWLDRFVVAPTLDDVFDCVGTESEDDASAQERVGGVRASWLSGR